MARVSAKAVPALRGVEILVIPPDVDAFYGLNRFENLRIVEYGGTGLDVFQTEPPSPDDPLFQLPNMTVTPHNAALTLETTDRMGLHAAMGIDEVLSGRQPSWPVVVPKEPRT